MYDLYVDAEFDAIRLEGKFQQAIISIGAVLCDDSHQEVDTFYALVHPDGFRRLTSVVRRMTQLKDQDIVNAASLKAVLIQMRRWLLNYIQQADEIQVYSFGPDDKRTLCTRCAQLHIDERGLFSSMIDLQKLISASVLYEQAIVSPTLSLDDLKYSYQIEGAVDHNALKDAQDLMKVHVAYLNKQGPDAMHVKAIVERKRQKQEETKRRQQEKLKRMMQERFRDFPQKEIRVPLYPEVIEQFQLWAERDRQVHIHWKQDNLMVANTSYAYASLQVTMQLHLQEVPSLCLRLCDEKSYVEKTYLLMYRNATMIETILKRVIA